MFIALVLISSALVVCIGLLIRSHHNQCVVCGRSCSRHAKTCGSRCRKVKSRWARSHRRDLPVTALKRRVAHSLRERGGESITITDNSRDVSHPTLDAPATAHATL